MTELFTTQDAWEDVGGTSLQGYIENISYHKLVETFGQPFGGDGYKIDVEWAVKFSDGTVATIYNWKNGPNYCGEDGIDPKYIRTWNVGGHGPKAWQLVFYTLHPLKHELPEENLELLEEMKRDEELYG